jgi:hypothetical protein
MHATSVPGESQHPVSKNIVLQMGKKSFFFESISNDCDKISISYGDDILTATA